MNKGRGEGRNDQQAGRNARALEMITCDSKESNKEIKIYGVCGRQNNGLLKEAGGGSGGGERGIPTTCDYAAFSSKRVVQM